MSLAVSTDTGVKFLDTNDLNNVSSETVGRALRGLACSADGGSLFGLCEGAVKQLMDGNVVNLGKASVTGQPAEIAAIVTRQKGDEIVFAQGNKVHVYDARSARLTSTIFEGHRPSAQISMLAVNIADTNVASLTASAILIHSLSSPHTRVSIKAPSDSPFTCLAFSRYKKTTLMTGHANGSVMVWDISRPNAPLRQKQVVKGEVVDIRYSPYNKRLCAIAGKDGDAALVDLEEEADKPFHRTIQGTIPLTCITFLPGGASLVAGTADGHLRVYNLRSLSQPPTDIKVVENDGPVLGLMVMTKKDQKTGTAEVEAKEVDPKTAPTKAAPLSEHPPNVPVASETRAAVRRSISTASQPDKTAPPSRRTSVATSSVVQKVSKPTTTKSSVSPRASARPSLASTTTSTSRSVSSRANPSSPDLPSISGSPPMPTKRVKAVVSAQDSVSAARQMRSSASTSKENPLATRKAARLSDATVTPNSSPTRNGARLQPPQPSTSTALIPSPAKRNSTGPAAVQLEAMMGSGAQAAELLRVAFASAMSDWRAESSRATRNLHMEVIRSARLQQNEFRRMMEDYMDEVTRLREENEMLRKENERLRRGY